jgi:hypothetical protein
MFQPVKVGFSKYLIEFYDSLIATTSQLQEFADRGMTQSIAWCPARMVDSAEDMLAMWQRSNSVDSTPVAPSKLPVILIAMVKDYVPTSREYTRQSAERQYVTIPNDPKERVFGLRYLSADIRTQVAIFAADEPTARSLAAQFCLFIDGMNKRQFHAVFDFANMDLEWGVQLESSDTPAISVQTDAKNLTILAIDLTLRTAVPMFDHPKDSEPNDGKGTDGDINDPHGYLLVSTTPTVATIVQ